MKRMKILYQMLKMTNIMKVIYVFLGVFLVSALLLMIFEPGINSFGDALWFCFSSVTTIGYGDYYAVTFIGRIIAVFISVYGIVIIAVFTGAIVNFVGEVQRIRAKNSVAAFLDKLENLD